MLEHSSVPPQKKLKFIPTAATFRLGAPLGVGTVGTVYRAESDDLDTPAAVKILHPNIAHDEQIVDRFQREIVIMERLNHPHIVRHYGGGLIDGQYFYAMQLLDHGSLKDRLRQHGPLSWPQAAAYAAQIASALQHAHNHGIIHRDLKPSNLFFAGDGRLVLGDFGIAHDIHDTDITADGITVGTYAYMSPEQICADREITGKADLYSLGCVLYEMLSGKPPTQVPISPKSGINTCIANPNRSRSRGSIVPLGSKSCWINCSRKSRSVAPSTRDRFRA
jgi:eukaryotic-like serine/threonine-protein kinase